MPGYKLDTGLRGGFRWDPTPRTWTALVMGVSAVGLIYATTYRLGNSAVLIFPFFLGVGGVYDVLFRSTVVASILHPEIRVLWLGPSLAVILWWVTRGADPARRGTTGAG